MANISGGSAKYEGFGKDGKGHVSTESGALDNQPYGFNTRFEDAPGTNPEELIAAAHASCFTMALAFQLADKGHSDGTIETTCVSVCAAPASAGAPTRVATSTQPASRAKSSVCWIA